LVKKVESGELPVNVAIIAATFQADEQKVQNDTSANIAETLAEKHGVSPRICYIACYSASE
jgi:hypothetical protein